MKRAIVIEKIWKVLMYASIALILFFVVSVIWSVFKRGLPVLSGRWCRRCLEAASILARKVDS